MLPSYAKREIEKALAARAAATVEIIRLEPKRPYIMHPDGRIEDLPRQAWEVEEGQPEGSEAEWAKANAAVRPATTADEIVGQVLAKLDAEADPNKMDRLSSSPRGVEMTAEMVAAGVAATEAAHPCALVEDVQIIYRAMHAAGDLQAENTRLHDRIKVLTDERDDIATRYDVRGQAVRELLEERDAAITNRHQLNDAYFREARKTDDLHAEIARLRAMLPAEGSGPDYHGPVKDGKAVPDSVHEQFHRAVGDVLAGKVMPQARDQMRKALDGVPAEKPVPNIVTRTGDPRRMGWRG